MQLAWPLSGFFFLSLFSVSRTYNYVRVMDFSVGVYLSLAFPDFLGHHNTNRFEENNTRESPFHGTRCRQKYKYLETGVVDLYGRSGTNGIFAIHLANPYFRVLLVFYEHITFSNFPHITHPYPPPPLAMWLLSRRPRIE